MSQTLKLLLLPSTALAVATFLTLLVAAFALGTVPTHAQSTVGLYDVFEQSVTNSKSYSNPFDFRVIELKTKFTSPSGKTYDYFGFHDGNGQGGQSGNVWEFRFMPDEVGTWNYTYSWSDGTAGGSGSFSVVDTGLPGPLRIASDNTWFFETARGEPFHARGFDMSELPPNAPTRKLLSDVGWIKGLLKSKVIDRKYNLVMWAGAYNRRQNWDWTWKGSWWENTSETKRFNIAVWREMENLMHYMKDNKVYAFDWIGMFGQGDQYAYSDMQVFLRYWVARHGAFYNYFGWSPTWEWSEVMKASAFDQIMTYVQSIDPWNRPLSIHDCSQSVYDNWLDFSLRQNQSRTVFQGNSRQRGQKLLSCDATGGVHDRFVNKPIIGSEDIWEIPGGRWNQPRNGDEVRRGAWGIQMAGIMPIYSELFISSMKGEGEDDVRRMFDFFYTHTNYRKYKQLNNLVSSSERQIASGIQGQEYLVYDENGGSISIDLSGASGSLNVLWFNPADGTKKESGTVEGGARRTLSSPFSGDTVLLMKKGSTSGNTNTGNTGNTTGVACHLLDLGEYEGIRMVKPREFLDLLQRRP